MIHIFTEGNKMNIILGEENVQGINDRYVVLELDRLQFSNKSEPVTAYCMVENMPLDDIVLLERWRTLHNNLIRNYRMHNWNFCEDAIEHLKGHWRGELDSFYDIMLQRIAGYRLQDPGADWTGVINVGDDILTTS
jgi:hypothetical protein